MLGAQLQRRRAPDAPRSLSQPSRKVGGPEPPRAEGEGRVCHAAWLPGPWPSNARGVRTWRVLLVLLAVWSTAETPYRLAFGTAPDAEPVRRRLEASALAVDLFFLADCALRTGLLLPVHAKPGATHAHVAVAWLRSWKAPLYLAASLPLDFIAASRGADLRVIFSLGLCRLLRLHRVAAEFNRAETNVKLDYYVVALSKFMGMLLLQCHFFACVFYFVARCEPRFEDTWIAVEEAAKPNGLAAQPLRRYLFSLYWATVTLASVGYGDTSPLTDVEFIVAIVYMLANIVLFAYVVGGMTALATAADEATRLFRKAFRDLEAYMQVNGLPEDIRAAMRSYLELRFAAKKEHPEVLAAFPPVLRARVSRLLHLPVLCRVPLLAGCGASFLDLLVCHVSVELFMPGAAVLNQHDGSLDLFFLASGSADVLVAHEGEEEDDDGDAAAAQRGGRRVSLHRRLHAAEAGEDDEDKTSELLDRIADGACFGEVPFLFHLPQPYTVRTRSLCRVLCLKRDAWTAAEVSHPRDARLASHAAADALAAKAAAAVAAGAASTAPPSRETLLRRAVFVPLAAAVAASLAARDAERVGELCLAAGRNDVLALRRALAAGVSASAADYDGRCGLHIAAAKGADAAIRYLLDHGADPSAKDAFGTTPLFEAVVNGHATAAAMLRSAGGTLGLRTAASAAAAATLGNESGAAAARRARDAGTLMCAVASSGDVPFLTALLANGLSPDAADYDRRTGLHLAAALGRTQVLSLLLDAGANPSAVDNFGRTPLLEAVRGGHSTTAALLCRRGATLGLVNDAAAAAPPGAQHAGSEMCQAAFTGDVDYLRRLLRAGASPDAADYDRRTAAHLACAEGLMPVALVLHAAGADFNAKDRWGRTPLDEADANGHAKLAHVLRELPPTPPPPPPPVVPRASQGRVVPDLERAALFAAGDVHCAPGSTAQSGGGGGSEAGDSLDEASAMPMSAGAMDMNRVFGRGALRSLAMPDDGEEGHVQGLEALRHGPRGVSPDIDQRAAVTVGTWLAALESPQPT